MDTNNDGRLDIEELEKGMNEFTALFQMQELDIVKIFHEIDSDKNGFIEHSEFIAAALDHQMFLNEVNLRKAFS